MGLGAIVFSTLSALSLSHALLIMRISQTQKKPAKSARQVINNPLRQRVKEPVLRVQRLVP
jgi:hypothetical protein